MVGKRSATPGQGFGRRVVPALAGVAVIALVGTLAVFADGYDAKEIPPLETSVWVTRDAGQYARVNTDLGEIDTVRTVADPVGVAQSGSDAVVFSSGYRQLWPVNAANPINLTVEGTAPESTIEPDAEGDGEGEDTEAVDPAVAQNTPVGTREVLSAGNYLLYLTDSGSVFVSSLTTTNGQSPKAFPVNPYLGIEVKKGEERPVYAARAIALSPEGRVLLYSASEKSVRVFDAVKSQFVGEPEAVQNPPDSDAQVQLAIAGDSWVLSSAGDGEVWLPGKKDPVKTGLSGTAQLQSWSRDARTIHLADQKSLISVELDSGAVTVLADGTGVPAAPVEVSGVVYAAWISTSGGSLWSSKTNQSVPLEVENDQLEDVQVIKLRFQDNGARAVLTEQSTGLLWTVPDGRIVPIDQWSLGDKDHEVGTVEVDDLAQQEPPVAVADVFGVRAGRLVSLPLLLNDHDPNKKDVLSIVPDSISGGLSDPAFGELGLVGNDQTAVVQVSATSGSATFSYVVTDGKAKSAPAAVTLTVVDDSINSAPEWCPVEGCVQVWPTPKIAPGGTAVVPVMDGWVDPEGDPIFLVDVRSADLSAPVSVVPMSDGSAAIRHNDPNASASVITLLVVVSDSRGAVTEKELEVTVGATPAVKASPVAVTASVDQKVTVAIAEHVTGGSGAYRVLDAVQSSSTGGGLIIAPNAAAGTVDVSASDPGEYIVTYSVQDAVTLNEQSSIIRLTVVPAGRPLSMAPLTAFVRANEDTTVDVLSAVQNTSGRVLLVTEATSSSPGLNVSVVAQSRLRVSGSTTDGEPGLIGTAKITVSDGGGELVQGEVSVFLVPSAQGVRPIAVPDSATVRAGAQVDIPVLLNDLSPRGERLVIHPDVQSSGAQGELAFASESFIRYLAPTVPGVYTLNYSAYLEGRPDHTDTAAVTVTVIAAGSNRAPEPPVLSARTNAGQTVLIPVPSYGMDPDGDEVTLVDVELPQPGHGVPSVSPDGRSIVYAAPAGGVPGGQVTFEYTVRDSNDATATGVVLIGVISEKFIDPSPVTYSDYVQVLRGSETPVTVAPLLNDRDPAQGELEIINLRPNAPGGPSNPEYARLEALIDPSTSFESGEIVLRSGDTLGTHSFVYTVQSSVSTSTSEGLIVVGVAEKIAPDMPIVTDTVVTAKDRLHLAGGIDVISGKVRWASGSAGDLKLSLWGAVADKYQVIGSRIAGDFPPRGDLVPFTLSGKDSSGADIVAHGFLRIPSFEDLRIQLKLEANHIEVAEEKSVDFDVRALLDLDKSDVIEIKKDDDFVVQRANSSCEFVSGTTARYTSGREAPWVDTCAMSVRLEGQKQWSTVAIPVWIMPKDPQAILSTIARTLMPGESTTIDLDTITSWEGDRVGNKKLLDYTHTFNGPSFVVEQVGKTLSIETRADAVPGTRETVQVAVSNFGGLTGGVTLVVGIAPKDNPRGATLNQTCDVSRGPSCTITVVGVPGEYDPFEGKLGSGLKLVSLGGESTVTCAAATVVVSGSKQVVATWPAGARPIGGECVVPLDIADAQNRPGKGQLTIDILGYPEPPTSLMTTGYSSTSATMAVNLGKASQAHPAINGVVLYEGGNPAPNSSCAPSGPGVFSCTVKGLVNGALHTYTARAVNSVGESLDTSKHDTWAYATPTVTSLKAVSVYDKDRTSPSRGAVDLEIKAGDEVTSFRILNNGVEIARDGDVTTVKTLSFEPKKHLIQVVPISDFRPPVFLPGGANNGEGAPASDTVTAVGTPSYASNGTATSTVTDTTASVSLTGAQFSPNGGAKVEEKIILWEQATSEPVCSFAAGALIVSGGDGPSASPVPAEIKKEYFVKACATNGFGYAESDRQGVDTQPDPNTPTGTFMQYTVSTSASGTETNIHKYLLERGPEVNPMAHWTTTYVMGDTVVKNNFTLLDSTNFERGIFVKYCYFRWWGNKCDEVTSLALLTPTTAPTTVTVKFPGGPVAEADARTGWGGVVVNGSAYGSVIVTVDLDVATEKATYTVSFTGDYSDLTATTHVVNYIPTPVDPGDGGEGGDDPGGEEIP